jgi:uncharacterized protein with von Willebrand factor type A (vWA) domain
VAESGEGRLAENILLFCRTLRQAGLTVGPGMMLDAVRAVAATGILRADDFRSALRAVLVRDPSEMSVFDQAFHLCFRDRGLPGQAVTQLLSSAPDDPEGTMPNDTVRRLAEYMAGNTSDCRDGGRPEMNHSTTYSSKEVFSSKDFGQMSEFELLDAKRMLRDTAHTAQKVQTRRLRASAAGHRYDLRRSLRGMLRNDCELLQLEHQRRGERPRALVLRCDISGSLSCYSRLFLQYAHALLTRNRTAQVFVFGTRLSNITRWLRNSDADVALQKAAEQVPDWDGGTRIADCLRRFNRDWGRRVLAGNGSIVLLTDGLERDNTSGLEIEMQRLRRSCRELIWMNPLLRYEKFEAQASGIRAMRPNVDRFVSAHSVATVTELGRLLVEKGGRGMQVPAGLA